MSDRCGHPSPPGDRDASGDERCPARTDPRLALGNPADEPIPASGPEAKTAELRLDLMQVVTVHTAMFEKLLFQGHDLPLDLAELFEDVANTYLTFSEVISRLHRARRSNVEQGPDAGIERARRMREAEFVAEPRV